MTGLLVKPSRYSVVVPLARGRALAYNTVSRALAVWSAQDLAVWHALETAGQGAMTRALAEFARGGFVVNQAADEVRSLERAFEGARADDSSAMVTIAPTLSCNFGCHYCFQGQDKPFSKMTDRTIAATKAYIRENTRHARQIHVTWYGGEPLMHKAAIWDLSEDIQAYCRAEKKTYRASMISNGFLLTRPVAERLAALKVEKVQITLDGSQPVHDGRRHLTSGGGSYAKIVENIEAITRDGLMRVSIRINIDSENEHEALNLLADLQACGFGVHRGVSVYFAPVESVAEASGVCSGCLSKTDYAEAELRLQAAAFDMGLMGTPRPPKFLGLCTAMKHNSFVVVPNGDIHKCWDTVMDATKRVGTVHGAVRKRDDVTRAAWQGFSPFDNAVCRDCALLATCAGACAFKFVHNDYASGESGQLPCPSWKNNISEQLFARAKAQGVLEDADWDPDLSPTHRVPAIARAARHSVDTMQTIHAQLTPDFPHQRLTEPQTA